MNKTNLFIPMKPSKLIYIVLLLICPFSNILAQPADYEDFYKTISSLSDEKLYSKLIVYQRIDQKFVNTYAQLGIVTKKLLLKTDPLKDFEQAMYLADNGILYLKLFTHFMTENESRSNRQFYANIPIVKIDNKFTNADLINYSKDLILKMETYRDSLKLVYRAIEQSKEYYGKCIELYKSLNNRFNNQNEVWLQTDDKLISEIKKIKESFDSTIIFFDAYNELTKTFTLKDYHQKYKLKPINTFRLDGLSNSNFLEDEFQIWDFGTWVDQFLAVYNSEIVSLRRETELINSWFVENEKLLREKKIDLKKLPKPIFDEKFIFRLGKYDNNSLVRELLAYRNSKYNFLLQYNDPLNSAIDTVTDQLNRKARYYNDLRTSKLLVDSSLLVFEKAISQDRINRFASFFSVNYGNVDGLAKYFVKEKSDLNSILNSSFDNLKLYLNYQKATADKLSTIKYKSDSIPISITKDDYSGKYKTNDVFWSSRLPEFAAGYEISKNTAAPFIAHIDKGINVKWYKQIEKPFAVTKDGIKPVFPKLFGYNGGCIGIYTKQNPDLVNTLVRLDSTGKEIFRTIIPIGTYPGLLSYDDINQKTLIAFKGTRSFKSEELETVTVCMADSSGAMKWKSMFDVAGYLVDVVKNKNMYQLFLNYKSYDIAGNFVGVSTNSSQWGILVINIDESGAIKDVFTIKQPNSLHVTNIIKLSGQSICLIGYKSRPGQTDAALYYAIINSSGKTIYSN